MLPLRIGCKWAGQNKHAGDLQVAVWFVVQLQYQLFLLMNIPKRPEQNKNELL